jgi:hypothetical protein
MVKKLCTVGAICWTIIGRGSTLILLLSCTLQPAAFVPHEASLLGKGASLLPLMQASSRRFVASRQSTWEIRASRT